MKKILLVSALLALMLPFAASAGERAAERITKSFAASKGGDLDMDVSGGDIRLVPWEKDEVVVVVEGLSGSERDNLKITQSGKTVTVEYNPRWGSTGDCSFTVSLPSQFNAKLHTSGGDLVVQGKLKGTLSGSTSGGDIRTGSIDGQASLKTSGGDIELGEINGDADVKTSGGDIRIGNVAKKLKAATSGGDVLVGDVGGEAVLSTAGGDVSVGNVSGKATLKTAGGNIQLAGANGSAEVKTAGGDIQLKKISGSVSAKTAGGNIEAELTPVGGVKSELSTAGGDVKLAVPADAKVTIDATIRIKERWSKGDNKYVITSDFETTTEDVKGGSDGDEIRKVYKLNGGGAEIILGTTNANIYIKKMAK